MGASRILMWQRGLGERGFAWLKLEIRKKHEIFLNKIFTFTLYHVPLAPQDFNPSLVAKTQLQTSNALKKSVVQQ